MCGAPPLRCQRELVSAPTASQRSYSGPVARTKAESSARYTLPVPDPGRFPTNRMVSVVCAVLAIASHSYAASHHSALTHSRQILIVTTPDWNSVAGTMVRFERHRAGAPWRKIGEPTAVVVGKSGMGWGHGLVSVSGHAETDPVKREGDGRSPAGVFKVSTVFGYAPDKPAAWLMPYHPLTPATECIDDRSSTHYNRLVERTDVTPDWNSSEHMRSMGIYYQWGAVIQQNPENRPGGGSCVFLHVSDASSEGTSGCTAVAQPQLEAVLAWLKPDDNPLIVEMPISEYKRAAKSLGLPPQ